MPEQFNLPGFDAELEPKRGFAAGRLRATGPIQKLFLALFPQSSDAACIAERAEALRLQHGLVGHVLRTDRLHVTLHGLAECMGARPQAEIDAAVAALSSVRHAPLDITFDQALSFAGSGAFVLRSRDSSAASSLVRGLGSALKHAGLGHQASSTPHMTLLYDSRRVAEHAIEPIRWTATEVVLVLSHVGATHHEWLARHPLDERN